MVFNLNYESTSHTTFDIIPYGNNKVLNDSDIGNKKRLLNKSGDLKLGIFTFYNKFHWSSTLIFRFSISATKRTLEPILQITNRAAHHTDNNLIRNVTFSCCNINHQLPLEVANIEFSWNIAEKYQFHFPLNSTKITAPNFSLSAFSMAST